MKNNDSTTIYYLKKINFTAYIIIFTSKSNYFYSQTKLNLQPKM
jgi:hypothetical protein